MSGGIYSNYSLRTCISSLCEKRRERKQSAVLTFGGFQAHVHGPASRHKLCWEHHCQTIFKATTHTKHHHYFRMESRLLGVCLGLESPAGLQAGEEAAIFDICRVAFYDPSVTPAASWSACQSNPMNLASKTGLAVWTHGNHHRHSNHHTGEAGLSPSKG